MAGVRMLADEAIRDGRQVTLLFGATSAREVYPSSLLPDEVEYVVATDDGSLGHARVRDGARAEYEGGPTRPSPADRCPCCGRCAAWPRAAGSDWASLRWGASGEPVKRTRRISRGAPQGLPPGLDGAEHGLRRRGMPRLRRHGRRRDAPAGLPGGPVFASEELVWEGAWS